MKALNYYSTPLLKAALPLLCCSVLSASAATPVGDMTGHWQLFVDDYLLASKDGVTRQYHSLQKYSNNPVLKVDQPWEHNVVACQTVLPAEDGKGYRMWYYCWTKQGDPDRSHALYATSVDGIKWEKPKLGVVEWKVNKSKDNNFIATAGSVMHTPDDPDPARRYKSVSSGKFMFKASPDGIRWEPLSKDSLFKAGDTGHMMWDPLTQKYRAYAKINATVTGLRRRAVGYSEGTDFENWLPMRLIMAPDDYDDRFAVPGSIQRAHIYNVPVMAYQNMYIGFLSLYRAVDDEGYFHGPIFTELVTSRDGIHWQRQEGERPPLLETGPAKSWDHGMVFPVSMLPVGGELRVYYSGYDGLHDYLPFHSAVGFATIRKDGFASLEGGDVPGQVFTKPIKGMKGHLRLNCEAGAGLLQVEVTDENGKVIDGYGKNDCNEPRGNGLDQVVTWLKHPELPATDQPLRLRFFLKNVSLYSFYAGDNLNVIDEKREPHVKALFTFEGGLRNQLGGPQQMKTLGTSRADGDQANAAFGNSSMRVDSPWRPLNTLQITETKQLGLSFTLAVMAKSADNQPARLFSSYSGNKPVGTSELVFEADPKGTVFPGLRFVCKGIPVTSKPVTFADGKYHHCCVTFDDGRVRFYLDGADAGEAWLPNGSQLKMKRDLLVGEDAEMGSDEQFRGHLDDVLVIGRALPPEEVKGIATKGAEAFFKEMNK